MKFLAVLVLVAVAAVCVKSFSSGLDPQGADPKEASACIVYLEKFSNGGTPAYYEMVCDDDLIFRQDVPEASKMNNLVALENSLKNEVQKRMGMDRGTQCVTVDQKEIWFTNCFRPSPYKP